MWGSLRANVVLESPLVVALSRSMQALNLTYREHSRGANRMPIGSRRSSTIATSSASAMPRLFPTPRLVGRPRPLLHVVVALPPILHRK